MKYQYTKAPNATELSVFTGLGETKLDDLTIAKDVPCQNACPAKTNVPGYIEAIFNGRPDEAYKINQEDNVFPGVLGRVCTRPCEDACRHNWTGVDGPVQICHLKRSAADDAENPYGPLPAWFDATGKKIAVIGGGPTGLTAARELKRYGHNVTIYERAGHLGGMMVDGIPKFRLPREVVESEISQIIDSGISVELNADIDYAKFEQLKKDHDAVLLSVGTMIPTKLNIGEVPADQSVDGLDFMNQYNNEEIKELEGDVVVIGGGFTAVDCARSCARAARKLLGAEGKVTIFYRRTEQFMAANKEEMEELENENIEIRTLCTPQNVIVENGQLKSVGFTRNILDDDSDPGGKPKMIPVENSEFQVPCNLLIQAIGQYRDEEILGDSLKTNEDQTTTVENVFAAGDFLNGGKDVITAVAQGKEASERIDKFLTGKVRKKIHVSIELMENNGHAGRERDHDLQIPGHMPTLDLLSRAKNNAEVELGLQGEALDTAASRCYMCHYKFEINQDKCIHCDWCIEVAPRDCIKRVSRIFRTQDGAPVEYVEASKAEEATYIYIDSDECVRCGKCLRVCPTEAISMRKMTRVACLSD